VFPHTSRGRRVEVPPWPPDAQDAVVSGLLENAANGAPYVAAHMERTARLAKALVKDLDLREPLARLIVLTARLHDIGKLGIPPWILEKPSPLTEYELDVMREHSVIGQAIPLPSRIVAVCDGFDAMTKPRVYSASMSIDSALHELERCSGTQFDPGVVAVFRGLFRSRFDRLAKRA
jgi:HD-GYP domain-containing protein (c-di-GMP phosphodiesterase class II)